MLYPLKFKPLHFSKIWGGEKLKSYYRHETQLSHVGETWDISGVENKESEVYNGVLAENTLSELVEVYMTDLVGEKVYERYNINFPLLVKLIDAHSDLSIQVHPDDEFAAEHENSYGKAEMWYVMEAEPGAEIIAGFLSPISIEEYSQRVENNTLSEVLNKIPVKKGDAIYLPPGTVHALCKGCLVLEIQQSSDITYRIFDYDRKDCDGKKRDLHTQKAKDAICYERWNNRLISVTPKLNEFVSLVKNEYFVINQLEIDRAHEYETEHIDSFILLSCVEGHVRINYDDDYITMVDGETILIPASFSSLTIIPTEKAKLLETYMG